MPEDSQTGGQHDDSGARSGVLAEALERALLEPEGSEPIDARELIGALEAASIPATEDPEGEARFRILVAAMIREHFAAWGGEGSPPAAMVEAVSNALWEHPEARPRILRLLFALEERRRPSSE